MTAFHELIIAAMIRWFCKPTDPVEYKRRQLTLVGTALILFVTIGIAFIHICLLLGPSSLVQSPSVSVTFIGLFLVLLDCRVSKSMRSARFLFALMLYFAFHVLYQRNGLAGVPHLMFVGFFSPALAFSLNFARWECGVWVAMFVVDDIAMLVLHLRKLIPTSVFTDPNSLIIANAITVLLVSLAYFGVLWFHVHIYTTELETRQTLEKELHLFMRVSHEIRTPITVIVGVAELMKDWSLSPSQKSHWADLASAARRLQSVANDLLAFSDPATNDKNGTTGGVGGLNDENESSDFNIRGIVDQAISFHLPTAEARKLNIYTDIAPTIPAHVNGAKSRLLCILDHLIGNAIKFTPVGSITIQVSLPEPFNFDGICDYHFEIRDTGMGMTAEELSSLFQPFFQADVGPARKFDGMGLGLALVDRLVRKWGRTVEAASLGPGSGSTFSFSAPFTVLPSSFRVPVAPNPTTTLANVLLIDDDEISAKGILQSMAFLSLSARRVTFATADDDMLSSYNGFIVVYPTHRQLHECPTMAPSLPVAFDACQEQVATIVQNIRWKVHEELNIIVSAPAAMQTWVRETLRCSWVKKPPSLSHLKSALRTIVSLHKSPSVSAIPATWSLPAARSQAILPTTGTTLPTRRSLRPGSGVVSRSSSLLNLQSSPAPTNRPSPPPRSPISHYSDSQNHHNPHHSPPSPGSLEERDSINATNTSPTSHPSIPLTATPPPLVPPPQAAPPTTASFVPVGTAATIDAFSDPISPSTDPPEERGETEEIGALQRTPSQQPQSTPPHFEITLPKPRILCVDDSPLVLRLLTTFISRTGFDGIVDTALSGEEALTMTAQNPYALIFMDFNMPGLSGADTTSRMRSSGVSIPIVGVTAAPNMREVCLASGMTNVIFKPFSMEMIAQLLDLYAL